MSRKLLHISVLVLVALAMAGCIEEQEPSYEQTTLVHIGDTAPDFEVETLDGHSITLSAHRDKVVLLTLFSSSCPDCHDQFEYIKDRITAFDSSKFLFLPIAREEGGDRIEQYRRENGYTFDFGLDPTRSIYSLYATRYVPRNYLIDRNGVVVSISAEPTHAQLEKLLQQIAQLTE